MGKHGSSDLGGDSGAVSPKTTGVYAGRMNGIPKLVFSRFNDTVRVDAAT